jgi:hypothetical protein
MKPWLDKIILIICWGLLTRVYFQIGNPTNKGFLLAYGLFSFGLGVLFFPPGNEPKETG